MPAAGVHAALGPCDYLDIFIANEIETAARVSALIRTFGHARTEIWRATEWDRFKEIVRTLPGPTRTGLHSQLVATIEPAECTIRLIFAASCAARNICDEEDFNDRGNDENADQGEHVGGEAPTRAQAVGTCGAVADGGRSAAKRFPARLLTRSFQKIRYRRRAILARRDQLFRNASIEIVEKDDGYKLSAELPGVNEENVDIVFFGRHVDGQGTETRKRRTRSRSTSCRSGPVFPSGPAKISRVAACCGRIDGAEARLIISFAPDRAVRRARGMGFLAQSQ